MEILLVFGTIQTVLGSIDPEDLGTTITHEHLLFDQSPFLNNPKYSSEKNIFFQPVDQKNLGFIRHHYLTNIDNAKLTDLDTAISEVMLYKQFGGNSIVDVTSVGLGRDPIGLAKISRVTGVNVIMGSSYYQKLVHPEDMGQKSEYEITQEIVKDINVGVDETEIRSGVIGEVGCGWPISENELKVVKASARAQAITGAPLLIHPGRDDSAPIQIIKELQSVDCDLQNTTIGHVERTIFEKNRLLELASTGCFINWDLFGTEDSYYASYQVKYMPNDATRLDQIEWIVSRGFEDCVLVAQDLANKSRLISYGGHGIFYLLSTVIPKMQERGFSDSLIKKFFIDNPKKFLTFTEVKNINK